MNGMLQTDGCIRFLLLLEQISMILIIFRIFRIIFRIIFRKILISEILRLLLE